MSPSETKRDVFHAGFLDKLQSKGLTAGVCDHYAPNDGNRSEMISETVQIPDAFVPKRPIDGNWQNFWAKIHEVAGIAQSVADDSGVTLVGFSLQFPRSTERRWGTPDPAMDALLDRPYSECLKDVLELLIYETPQIAQALRATQGCLLAVDLPTRTLGVPVEDTEMSKKLSHAWGGWGLRARSERDRETGQPEIVAGTLEPADAIEILTTALNRRPAEAIKFQVDRARCCKLISWSQWKQIEAVPDPTRRRNRKFWAIESSPRPKQIHFLGDFVSNGIFNEAIQRNQDPYRIWFQRGFLLSSASEQAGEWLQVVRAFANGDRVGAFKAVHAIGKDADHSSGKTYQFFRRCATGWPEQLEAEDMQRLFAELD